MLRSGDLYLDGRWRNAGILKQMSSLFDRTFETSTDLNRFRKELIASISPPAIKVQVA